MSDSERIKESKPRDLLQRFVVCGNANKFSRKSAAETIGGEDDGEKIELSLGLSLNGRFGVDPQRGSSNMLIRATSVADFAVSGRSKDETAAFLGLTRTCSLPAETEDEWRKRKELQSQRRLEAKRKRVEKMKNGRVVKERLLEVDRSSEESGRGEVVINGSRGVDVKSEKVAIVGWRNVYGVKGGFDPGEWEGKEEMRVNYDGGSVGEVGYSISDGVGGG